MQGPLRRYRVSVVATVFAKTDDEAWNALRRAIDIGRQSFALPTSVRNVNLDKVWEIDSMEPDEELAAIRRLTRRGNRPCRTLDAEHWSMRAKNPGSGSARLARSLRRRTLDAEHWPIKIVVRMKDPLDASEKVRTYSYFGWVTGDRKQVLNRKLRQARKEHPDAESIEVLADEEALRS